MEMLRLMVYEPDIRYTQLHSIRIPTLVIAGTRDIMKRAHTELIADGIPNAALVVIKGNHFIANKKAAAFNREVEKICRK